MDIPKLLSNIGYLIAGTSGGLFVLSFKDTMVQPFNWIITICLFIVAFIGLLQILLIFTDEMIKRHDREVRRIKHGH